MAAGSTAALRLSACPKRFGRGLSSLQNKEKRVTHMSEETRARQASDWFRAHTVPLRTLHPDGATDDLEPLREIIGDARVVALGEGAHFVREFTHARERCLRFLSEECGFTVLAFEFGFGEAFAFDRWLRGEGSTKDLARLGGTTNSGLNADLAHWLWRHNARSGHPLRFVGLDLPSAAGDLRPVLESLAQYLGSVDPECIPLVDTALGVNERFASSSIAAATPRWAELDSADQDALTVVLARLSHRMRALKPLYVERGGRHSYAVALRNIDAATATEVMIAAMRDVYAGQGMTGDVSVREHYMAQSLQWHLERLPSDTRIVLCAHNFHIQKTPVYFGDEFTALPMGLFLHRVLGGDYRAVAMTYTADAVPEMDVTTNLDAGFSVVEAEVSAPEPGSVEAALRDTGFDSGPTLTNLRGAPSALDSIRGQSETQVLPVATAFDGVLSTPTTTTYYTESLTG